MSAQTIAQRFRETSLPARVVARFKQGDSFGDPDALLREFVRQYEQYTELVPKIAEYKTLLAADPRDERALLRLGWEFGFKVINGFARLRQVGGPLFLGLLQKFELAPKLRKGVEACAKFYSKSRIQKPGRGEEMAAYEKGLETYEKHVAVAKLAVAGAQVRDDAGSAALNAGPFKVVNTGGFPVETMETVAAIVAKAATLLQRKGLGRVCYGDVLVSNTLSRASVLAFYVLSKDEMFVRANLKPGNAADTLHTVIHELAHRLQFKFLKSRTNDIVRLYTSLGYSEADRRTDLLKQSELRPAVGTEITAKGRVYVVERVVYDKIHLYRKDDPKMKATWPTIAWLEDQGLDRAIPSKFVSTYAKKDPDENFAEMVAAYCLDRLPDDGIKALEAILF